MRKLFNKELNNFKNNISNLMMMTKIIFKIKNKFIYNNNY